MTDVNVIIVTVIITCGVIAAQYSFYLIAYSNGYGDGCEDTRNIFKQGGKNG